MGKVAYFPFGGLRTSNSELGTDKLFTGQRLDQTGLYFYNARYYDATIGRFISPDTVVPNPANPQSLNRYSYCLNNPLRYTDPSGHYEFDQAALDYATSLGLGLWDMLGVYAAIAGCLPASATLSDTAASYVAAWGVGTLIGDPGAQLSAPVVNVLANTCIQGNMGQGIYNRVMENSAVAGAISKHWYEGLQDAAILDPGINPGPNTKAMLTSSGYGLYDNWRNANGFDNKLARLTELGGGIVLATAGGVAILIGATASLTGIGTVPGLIIGSAGGVATNLGWEMARDSIYDLSGGAHGNPLTVSDWDEIAWGASPVPTGYGPWGWTPTEGWNGP